MDAPSRGGIRAGNRPVVPQAAGSLLAPVVASAQIWATLLLVLGLLEAAVLYVKLPFPLSASLLVSLVWSPLLLGAVGLVAGVVVGAGLSLVRAILGRRALSRDPRGTAWAVAMAGLFGFYWVYAANRLYPGTSREAGAMALDGAAAVGAFILLLALLRRGRAGLTRAAMARVTTILVLFLWLPFYALSASPQLERARGEAPSGPSAAPAVTPGAGREPRMNVLLIMMDTVRADCLGCYGSTECPTPNIDRFAQDAMLFEQAVTSEPLTRPSVCTMFTGLSPRTHGVDSNTKTLRGSFVTLAETLRDAGYATAAFTAASVLSGYYGTDQGFDLYTEPSEPWWYLRSDFALRRLYISLTSWADWWIEIKAADVNRRALPWLRRERDRPFFAFVHYFDPHFPYRPPRGFDLAAKAGLGSVPTPYEDERERFVPGFEMPGDYLRMEWLRYQGEIAYVDANVGALLGALDNAGLTDRTLVVLVADHGESFEHEVYFSHGTRLYDSQVRVPLVIRDPRGRGALRVPSQVGLVDLCPTILGLVGAPSGVPTQGRSLVPLIEAARAGRPSADRPVYCQTDLEDTRPHSGRASYAVRTPPWKYIESPVLGLTELYDLVNDPAETVNVAKEFPQVSSELGAALARWLAATPRLDVAPSELSPERAEALRALGYAK